MLPRLRASAVCVHDGRLLCVRLRDPQTKIARLFVPGGAVEPSETPRRAAERETCEETGYVVVAETAGMLVISYPFRWHGRDMAVTTHFFRSHLRDAPARPRAVHDASYHEGACWLPVERIERELGFHGEIVRAVRRLVS